jgi:hypothetical protein
MIEDGLPMSGFGLAQTTIASYTSSGAGTNEPLAKT